MSFVPYKITEDEWFWKGPETAYRDSDTTNGATDTFYPTPILLHAGNPVMKRQLKLFEKHYSGSKYKKYISKVGYNAIELTFSGPVLNRSWLYYLTDACTTDGNYRASVVFSGETTASIRFTTTRTIAVDSMIGLIGTLDGSTTEYTITDNDVSSGTYVDATVSPVFPAGANTKTFTITKHKHVFINTATHVNPPKSFQLLHYLPNDKSGGVESVYELITGCIVTHYEETADAESNACEGTWTVLGARIVTGTVLAPAATYKPVYPAVDYANFADAALTWTKNSAVVYGMAKGYTFTFKTDKRLSKGGNSYYPYYAKSPTEVEPSLKITWEAWETDSYDGSQDDPHTALVKAITLKNARNTLSDYLELAFTTAFQEMAEDPEWVDGNLIESHEFSMSPHEAGTFTITEMNDIDYLRYEAGV
jgi:hypothetical protein